MGIIRRILTAVIMVLVIALQSAVVARWNLPGATPDLVLVFVAAFAMKHDPARTVAFGFFCGLLLDATPPSTGIIGINALSLTVTAYVAAQLRADLMRSVFGPILFVAVASAASVVLHVFLSALLGAVTLSLGQMFVTALATALYGAMLASVVVPVVHALLKSLMPAPTVFVRR